MKALRPLFSITIMVLSGGYTFALEAVPWGHQDYAPQFSYFTEGVTYTPEAWGELAPEDQETALREAESPALERQQALGVYYSAAMQKWDGEQLREYAARTSGDDLNTVRVWLGEGKAAAPAKKLSVARGLAQKAETRGLTDADAARLRPYLTEEAIADLQAVKASSALEKQAARASAAEASKADTPKGAADSELRDVSGAVSGPGGGKVFCLDGNEVPEPWTT